MSEGAPRPAAGTLRLEWSQLVEPYGHLRVRDVRAESRLAATVAEQGQRSAALVVNAAESKYALIDGYRRARALRGIGRDTIDVVALEVDDAEALAYCHRLETARRRSALEDGWLVRELVDTHGRRLVELRALIETYLAIVDADSASGHDDPVDRIF